MTLYYPAVTAYGHGGCPPGQSRTSQRFHFTVNSQEIVLLQDWDEQALTELVARYVLAFRRLPSRSDLLRFQRARAQLMLRVPGQTRRRATLVSHL
jgi:hypothetical protein